jgi:hypothetical protein
LSPAEWCTDPLEIERATAAGDLDRAQKLADLLRRVIARISRDIVADGSTDAIVVPRRPTQLASIARRISTEALSAELAAEHGDWEKVHATFERLGLLFAEYRLCYVQCLAPKEHHA